MNGEHNQSMTRYNDRIVKWFLREINQYADFVSYIAKEVAEKELGMTLVELFELSWSKQRRERVARKRQSSEEFILSTAIKCLI